MSGISEIREELNAALDSIVRLERGLPLLCSPIEDIDQREVLMNAKSHVLRALDIEGAAAVAEREVASAGEDKGMTEWTDQLSEYQKVAAAIIYAWRAHPNEFDMTIAARYVEVAVKAEREECAKISDDADDWFVAAAIRARGDA
jgi:hypothetical protein